jgi:hypothetical protein
MPGGEGQLVVEQFSAYLPVINSSARRDYATLAALKLK